MKQIVLCIIIMLAFLAVLPANAATAAFTYQGKLADSTGNPLSGSYDLSFKLYDALTAGNQVGSTVSLTGVNVSGGLFTVQIDFGASAFNTGADRWLETTVGTTTLSPRVKLTATPSAIYAQSVPWSGITGAPTSLPPSGLAGGDLTGTYPNPTVGTDKIGNTKLLSDSASLAKVSGGAISAASGKIGIGVATPTFPVSFADVLGDKISLYGQSVGTQYGFGIQAGLLQIFSPTNSSDIAFGYGTSGVFTENMRIRGNGRVGIGVSVPSEKLEVAGTVYMTGFRLSNGTSNTGKVLTSDINGFGTWQPLPPPSGTAGGDLTGTYPNPTITANAVGSAEIIDGAVAAADLANDAASMAKVSGGAVNVSAGNIGVGTATPATKLDVVGTAKMTGFQLGTSATAGQVLTTNATGVGTWQALPPPSGAASGDLTGTYPGPSIATGAVDSAKILDGAVTSAKILDSTVAAADLASDAASMAKVSGGAVTASSGNVGIGTASPAAKLDVAGTTKMTGFQLGTSATAGQVLTANASGVGTWQSPPTSLPPSGSAGGDLTGTYPNPTIAANAVGSAEIADGTVALADLATDSVNGTKVVDNSITYLDLASDSQSLIKVTGGVMDTTGEDVRVGNGGIAARLQVNGDTAGNAFVVNQSALVLDQAAPGPVEASGGYSGNFLWQSFTVANPLPSGASTQLGAIQLYMNSYGNDVTFEIRVYSGYGTGGTRLGTYTFSGTRTEGWHLFQLSPAITVVPGGQYTFHVVRTGGSGNSEVHLWFSTNDYTRGTSFFASDDYMFKTYQVATVANQPSLLVNSNTYVGMGVDSASITHRLQLPNTASAAGQGQANAWITYSSKRWKTNITPIQDALSKVEKLQGVYYDWKPEQGGKHDIGFVAEEVGKVVPELVSWDAEGKNVSGMDYARVNALLVEAIKQQQKQIEDQQKQIDELRKLLTDSKGK